MTDSAPARGTLVLRVLAVLALLMVAVLAFQMTRTGLALLAAKRDATVVRTQLAAGNTTAARATARDLGHRAHVARTSSDGVLWRGVELLPVVGDDVAVVRKLAAALDEASGAIPEALKLYDELDGGLRSSDGRIDLQTVADLQPAMVRMSHRMTAAEKQVAGVHVESLLPPLRSRARSALTDLHAVAGAAHAGEKATALVPAMLGGEEPRSYVLVAQNNAEIRSTGGLPGALVTLNVDHGKITLGGQRSFLDFPKNERPVEPVPADEAGLYGTTLAWDLRDMTATPDFPRAAARIAALVHRAFGDQVDGVVSMDPVTLAEVLRATGPVEGPDREQVGGDNALEKLLHEPYQRFNRNEQQDAFFAGLTQAIFNRFLGGQITPALLDTLVQAVDQRRVLLWSQRPDEERELAGTAIAGELPQGKDSHPQVGIYLNDGSAGKVEYYLRYTTGLESRSCSGGRQQLRASIDLRSLVPSDPSGLSDQVTGIGGYSPKGWIKLQARIYAPTGGRITRLVVDGKRVATDPLPHDGRQVSFVEMMLKPGQSIPITADIVGARGATADPTMEWTPSMTWGPTEKTVTSACS